MIRKNEKGEGEKGGCERESLSEGVCVIERERNQEREREKSRERKREIKRERGARWKGWIGYREK